MKNYKGGLTSIQVSERMEKGQFNKITNKNSKTIPDILKEHIFTLFNFINLILAAIILIASLKKPSLFNQSHFFIRCRAQHSDRNPSGDSGKKNRRQTNTDYPALCPCPSR